jgi:hypothetical protein
VTIGQNRKLEQSDFAIEIDCCGGMMVSGWDKNSGPKNDYAPKPWSRSGPVIFWVIFIVATAAFAYALSR